ncbi:MAG: ribonuclease Z [Elusimicrobia bacterium]|nr:ribonuclease Z [Elusimicrobiota bacterium]
MARPKLIILGSGAFAAESGKVRNPAGYAVAAGGRLLLFDLGFGNVRQLARAGFAIEEVSDVFISHRHPDHVGDLAALLFTFRYGSKPKTGRLRLWGPRGFGRFLRGISSAYRPWLDPRAYRLEIRELSGGARVARGDWTLATMNTAHPTPTLAFRWSYKGRSLVYSGDTGYAPGLAEFASGCDLLLLECTVSRRDRVEGHLNPRQALGLIDQSRCRRAILTHLSRASAREASRLLRRRPDIRLAEDLSRFEI